MNHINLETYANGAVTEQVNKAIEKVAENIQDPNTEAEAVRKVTMVIAFKPNDNRDFVAVGVQTKTTLAPATGVATAMAMGKDLKTGEVQAVEIGKQIPGQMELPLEHMDSEEIIKTVDPSTGEIYETPVSNAANKVIDLRNARQA